MRDFWFVFILMGLVGVSSIYAKSFKSGSKGGHEADMYAVFPFERQASIDKMFHTIHETIDLPSGYFPGLRDAPHQKFSWKKYGHRILFHWGFNENPRNAHLLGQLVRECHWSKSVEEAFWKKVIDEQARRNRLVMSTVGGALQFGMSGFERDYANAFGSIVYDIHLLGDYSTTMAVPLQPIDPIISDLQKALFDKLKGGDQAKAFNKQLELIKKSGLSPEEKAERVLAMMKERLPKLLLTIQSGYFKRHFEKKGLKLKV